MILDLICIAVFVILALIGYVRGMAKLILGLFNGLVGLIGAYLLFMPVYNLLYSLFLGNLIGSVGATINLSFLDAYASTLGKTGGVLIMEYVAMFLVYVCLSFTIGLLWKLLKNFICKIFELPVLNVVNKIAGLCLGSFFGFLIIFVVLYVWNLIGTLSFVSSEIRLPAINALNNISSDSVVVKPLIIENFDTFTAFFSNIIDLILGGFGARLS